MIILRKLEILTFLRIVVTYHFEYTAAALNPVVFCSGNIPSKLGRNDFALYTQL